MTAQSYSRKRAPQARVARHRELILDAALVKAASSGVPSITLAGVARDAGLSTTPVAERFESVESLLAALWRERLQERWERAFVDLAAAIDSEHAARPAALVQALTVFQRPCDELSAVAEVICESQFNVALRAQIGDGISAPLASLLTPSGRRLSRTDAAKRGYVFAVALGLLACAPLEYGRDCDLSGYFQRLAAGVQWSGELSTFSHARASHLGVIPEKKTGDPVSDAIIAALFDLVALQGFPATTATAITKRAGVPEAALYTRYAGKSDLFLEATVAQHREALAANESFSRRLIAQYGEQLALAALIGELQRPNLRGVRAIQIEQLRFCWQNPKAGEQMARLLDLFVKGARNSTGLSERYAEASLGFGVTMLAIIHEPCYRLPYQAFTRGLAG